MWRAPMDELDTWLETSIGAEPLRAEVRQACGGSLEDLRSCELEDLEGELPLSTWPPLERQRFLRAWRDLRGENDVDDAAADDASADEAAADDAAADTDEEPAAVLRPPSPAPTPEPVSPPPPSDNGPRYQVGDQVEARWKGGERYYPALVLVARVDGSVDLRYTDGDTESRVPPMLLRPLARRRGRARRAGCGVLRRRVRACAGRARAPCFADGGGALRRRVGTRGAADDRGRARRVGVGTGARAGADGPGA